MNELIFASNNQNKSAEVQAAIGALVRIVTLSEAGIHVDIPEPYDTIEKNASEKSRVIYSLTGKDCFAEDTGLEVDVLNGEPGVRSARYSCNDEQFTDNTSKLLNKLIDCTDRNARFRTIISLRYFDSEFLFEGICYGTISNLPKGSNGFGYDSVFIPQGSEATFAQMSLDQKALFSHRKKALDKMIVFLQQNKNL